MAKNVASHLVFGVGHWNNDPANLSEQQEMLAMCRKHGIDTFDVARHYSHGESEKFLGNEGLSSEFKIITKAPMGLFPNGSTKEGIIEHWEESSKALKTDKVAFYLLHCPDDGTPISETMEGIQTLYEAGHFYEVSSLSSLPRPSTNKTKFGISNFSSAQVAELHSYAKSKGYILPTVYQAVYSLCSRKNEFELFPLLRSLNIKIQAYSALASGFLVKTPSDIKAGKGLFDPSTVLGKIVQDMYGKPSYLKFLEEYRKLCEEVGESPAGLAYRLMVWNSALKVEEGDIVCLGASSAGQLENTILEVEKGKLDDWVVQRLDAMWGDIEVEAPGDNFGTYKKLMKAGIL
ncbi:related to aldehyde reductase (GliO) [Phialocephala subalpina]|uniref:Related to aldehyde reductase (GliO) n=1 Tax=Phialocephala subalpina TaxID=576137 RepID=A0A1L7XDU7_9HELO|nr:related to aldehyde reductase (GliO) [Phialocephala subalpina]